MLEPPYKRNDCWSNDSVLQPWTTFVRGDFRCEDIVGHTGLAVLDALLSGGSATSAVEKH